MYPEAGNLRGPYKKAFLTLWSLLEDSGWLLAQPGSAKDEEDAKVCRLLRQKEPGHHQLHNHCRNLLICHWSM